METACAQKQQDNRLLRKPGRKVTVPACLCRLWSSAYCFPSQFNWLLMQTKFITFGNFLLLQCHQVNGDYVCVSGLLYETSFWSLGVIPFPFMYSRKYSEFYQSLNKSSFLSFPFLFLARFIFWPNLSNINWEIILFIVKSGKKTSKPLKTDFVSTKKLCEESVIIFTWIIRG